MKPKRRSRLILWVILLVLVLIQFIPVDRSTPEVDPAQDLVSALQPPGELGWTIRNACYDCHSYETEYPWYSYIAPVAQWLQGHIKDGRKHLNFSIWTTYTPDRKEHKFKDLHEVLEEKTMPLQSFTWMHPEARLTDARREEMIAWFEQIRSGGGEVREYRQQEEEDDD